MPKESRARWNCRATRFLWDFAFAATFVERRQPASGHHRVFEGGVKCRMNPNSLKEKFALIHEHWRPKVVARLNGQEIKLVKFQGVFPWHLHEQEDEMFLVWRGQMSIEFRDRRVTLSAGDFCVVPRGVEHRTMADAEAEVIIFEPAETRNTGNIVEERFTAPNDVAI